MKDMIKEIIKDGTVREITPVPAATAAEVSQKYVSLRETVYSDILGAAMNGKRSIVSMWFNVNPEAIKGMTEELESLGYAVRFGGEDSTYIISW